MTDKPLNLHLPDVPQLRAGNELGPAEIRQIDDALRTCRRNFQRVREILERAITSGAIVAEGVVGEDQLTTEAKTLVGDVTGLIGSLGATVTEKIRGANVPAPTASEDGQAITYDDGTTAFVYTALFANPLTTQGDIIKQGASDAERLAIGADNTVLSSDGTDPGWETITSLLDSALGSTRGSILYRGASGWAILTPGTAGHSLQSAGAGADPLYAAGLPSGTQGDVIYYNGSAWVVLAAGTAGQQLQTAGAGANPLWGPGGTPGVDFDIVTTGTGASVEIVFDGDDNVVWTS